MNIKYILETLYIFTIFLQYFLWGNGWGKINNINYFINHMYNLK